MFNKFKFYFKWKQCNQPKNLRVFEGYSKNQFLKVTQLSFFTAGFVNCFNYTFKTIILWNKKTNNPWIKNKSVFYSILDKKILNVEKKEIK